MKRKLLAIGTAAALAVAVTAPARAWPLPPVAGGAAVAGHAAGAGAPWALFACPALLIFSAAVVANRDHRELTLGEAWTCGVAGLFAGRPAPYVPKHRVVLRVRG